MATIYLLIANCILSFVTSQIPIDLPGWDNLPTATNNPTCEAIGGYDYANNLIKIYGGANVYGGGNTNKIVFNPNTGDYIVQNPTGLSTPLYNTSSDSTQIIGPNADNIIYFISTNTMTISGLDMNDDSITTYAYLNDTAAQYSPGLCMDDDTRTLYSVGSNSIQTCIGLNATVPPVCIPTQQDTLSMLKSASCEYYNGSLFIFGGQDGETVNDIVSSIWKCDPSVQQNCIEISVTLTVPRADIRSVKIDCFSGNYVALIGGRLIGGDPTSRVQLFDLKMESIYDSTGMHMGMGRKNFVGVFVPVGEEIFVFGGSTNIDGTSCTKVSEVTVPNGDEGLCFTSVPTMDPTIDPTSDPTVEPTSDPTMDPTVDPTSVPSVMPSGVPTGEPSQSPVPAPTQSPEKYEPGTPHYETSGVSYAIIIVILVIICLLILACLLWYQREEKKNEEDRMAQDMNVSGTGAGAGDGDGDALVGVETGDNK